MGILSRIIDRRIERFQSDLIEHYYEEINVIYRQMRGWRHDFHNHIQSLKASMASENYDAVNAYLDELNEDLMRVDTFVKTGNIMLDAILNSKLSMAQAKQIAIHAKAGVPAGMKISDIDLCILIGNLLDNAIEACLKLPEEKRFLRVYIEMKNKHLYLSVTNSAGKKQAKAGVGFYSEKRNGIHGFGLSRIDGVVRKYGGYLSRASEDGGFTTEILLPTGL